MGKRFTDISKWTNNKWYFNLSIESKLFWIYLLDSCDSVGVWEENIKLANITIGYTYSLDTLLKDFKKQIYIFKDNRKWWIKDFCDFQYGILKEDSLSKPIQSYISLLKKHSLWIVYEKGIDTLKEKEKDIEKERVEEKEKEQIIYPFGDKDFLEFWDLWKRYKKEQFRFVYKPIGEQAALKKIGEISRQNKDIAMKIIFQSMSNGWQGLFALKTDFDKSGMYDEFRLKNIKTMADGLS